MIDSWCGAQREARDRLPFACRPQSIDPACYTSEEPKNQRNTGIAETATDLETEGASPSVTVRTGFR